MKATYGVSGMMEWIALIPAGQNIVRVRFSGGSLSGYGVTPATFTTANPVVMRLIEESGYFRRGKIRLLNKEYEAVASDISGTEECVDEKERQSVVGNVAFKKEKR